jgi:putative lipoprotein
VTGALVALAIAVGGRTPVAPPSAPDPWFGADKARHFFVAGFVQSVGFSVAVRAGSGRREALALASAATVAVSLAKEARDRRAGGRFSARDLVWDALGAAVYSSVLVRTATR